MESLSRPAQGIPARRNISERAAACIVTACGFFAVLVVCSIAAYMVASGIPALYDIGIADVLFGTAWEPKGHPAQFGIFYVILTSLIGDRSGRFTGRACRRADGRIHLGNGLFAAGGSDTQRRRRAGGYSISHIRPHGTDGAQPADVRIGTIYIPWAARSSVYRRSQFAVSHTGIGYHDFADGHQYKRSILAQRAAGHTQRVASFGGYGNPDDFSCAAAGG